MYIQFGGVHAIDQLDFLCPVFVVADAVVAIFHVEPYLHLFLSVFGHYFDGSHGHSQMHYLKA